MPGRLGKSWETGYCGKVGGGRGADYHSPGLALGTRSFLFVHQLAEGAAVGDEGAAVRFPTAREEGSGILSSLEAAYLLG